MRQADAAARGAQIIDEFPVGAWREGANHHPVEAVVSMPRRLASHVVAPQSRSVRFDQELLLRDIRQTTPTAALRCLREEVGAQVQGVDNLSQSLLQAAAKWYTLPPRPERRPTQSVELAHSARHMWEIFRQMRQCRRTAQGILSAWRLWAQFQKAHQIHKQRSKQRVKQKRDELLEQAQISARDGHLFGMWKIVKQLAPKAPRKRLQLNRDGHMLSPEEELQWIVQAYGDRYGVGTAEPAWTYQPRASDSGVTIDAADLEELLRRLNPRKAVPSGSAPPVLLKACGSDIAQALATDINCKWNSNSPQVYPEWSDATVALLPKAHGRNRSPLDWRPIGLQDCLGKRVMTLLLRQARKALIDLVRRHPQTAYIPGRSTSTAPRQVFEHCHQVRERAQGDRLTIHQRAAGQRPPQYVQVDCKLVWTQVRRSTWPDGSTSRMPWTWRAFPSVYKTYCSSG